MKKLFALAFIGALLFSGMAYAVPIQWSGNGHWYEVVSFDDDPAWDGFETWGWANWGAGELGGNLATLTSAEENAFVWDNFGSEGYWLGGSQAAGVWNWVTGEDWDYTNWASGEPGAYNLQILGGLWGASAKFGNGFIVEFENAPVGAAAAHAPEPATMILLGTGLVGLAGIGRKKFKK